MVSRSICSSSVVWNTELLKSFKNKFQDHTSLKVWLFKLNYKTACSRLWCCFVYAVYGPCGPNFKTVDGLNHGSDHSNESYLNQYFPRLCCCLKWKGKIFGFFIHHQITTSSETRINATEIGQKIVELNIQGWLNYRFLWGENERKNIYIIKHKHTYIDTGQNY